MSQTDEEKRFDVASLTLEMVGLVEHFLDGRATREQLCSWAHKVQKTHGRSAFVHNGPADALGDVSLIVEIEVAVQVAPRGFSGFQMTRSRHEEELQQL
ncbi:MAG TPA: hypothetical protein VGL86_08850, partial [Polyangia bacterium]